MSLSPYFQPAEGGDSVFGVGALNEVGADARALEMTRVAIYTDSNVANSNRYPSQRTRSKSRKSMWQSTKRWR